MPAYNFKKEFAAKVLDGSKPFTIRAPRKRKTVKGDRLFLFTGMRTRNCVKLLDTIAADVFVIVITSDAVYINDVCLMESMKEGFARLDGFNSYTDFLKFHEPNFNKPIDMIVWVESHAKGCNDYINKHKAT